MTKMPKKFKKVDPALLISAVIIAAVYVGVFVLEGSTAAWKTIHILHDNGESYVVELDKSSTDHLWPGDEIIVGARNLYDGKVVR